MSYSETIMKLKDVNVDGNGTDVEMLFRVYGKDLSVEVLDRVKDSIGSYKMENEGEWDSDGCFEAAMDQLIKEGYEVYPIYPAIEMCI